MIKTNKMAELLPSEKTPAVYNFFFHPTAFPFKSIVAQNRYRINSVMLVLSTNTYLKCRQYCRYNFILRINLPTLARRLKWMVYLYSQREYYNARPTRWFQVLTYSHHNHQEQIQLRQERNGSKQIYENELFKYDFINTCQNRKAKVAVQRLIACCFLNTKTFPKELLTTNRYLNKTLF